MEAAREWPEWDVPEHGGSAGLAAKAVGPVRFCGSLKDAESHSDLDGGGRCPGSSWGVQVNRRGA